MPNQNQNQKSSPGDVLFTIAIVAIGVLLGVLWTSAEFAMWLFHGHTFHVSSAIVAQALFHFPKHLSDPAAAWPAPFDHELSDAVQYWCAIWIEVAIPALLAIGVYVFVRRIRASSGHSRSGSLDRRTCAGVIAQGRFAKTAELRPLFARLPLHGRFLLGKVGRHYLATEPVWTAVRGRRQTTGPGAIAVVAPSRSGKAIYANAGMVAWDGPMISVMVKTDSLEATRSARAQLGEIKVIDPAGVTGIPSDKWSPLTGAATTDGAMRSARALVEAAPRDTSGVSSGQFWTDMAESLIAGLLVLAANAEGRSVADPEERAAAEFASQTLEGLWRNDHRTASSVYTTARTVVWPWVNPVVAATATDTTIDAEWLLSVANSLYVSIPLSDQERLRPVLGGLLNDLIAQVYDRFIRTNRPLDPPPLIVIDEAATLRPEQLACSSSRSGSPLRRSTPPTASTDRRSSRTTSPRSSFRGRATRQDSTTSVG